MNEMRRALLPPLRFAMRDDFAALGRLKNFGSLLLRVQENSSLEDDANALVTEMAAQFDGADLAKKKHYIVELWQLLGEEPEQGAAHDGRVNKRNTVAQAQVPKPRASKYVVEAPTLGAQRTDVPKPRAGKRIAPTSTGSMAHPVERLFGIGKKRAERLVERGLHTVGDILSVLPRAYQRRKDAGSIGSLQKGDRASVSGSVVRAGQLGRGRGARFEVQLDDGSGIIRLVFFRFSPWTMKRQFVLGKTVTATGEVKGYGATLQMAHPQIQSGAHSAGNSGVIPIYPEVQNLHPLEMARTVRAALEHVRNAPPRDPIDDDIRVRADVVGLLPALFSIHDPPADLDDESIQALNERSHPAFRRFAFEEMLVLQLAMAKKRRSGTVEVATPIAGRAAKDLFADFFPYPPTGAQVRVTDEILADLQKDVPMARLLQGDVGAGKTAVAAACCLRAAESGIQVALMAPTELLAGQHYKTLSAYAQKCSLRVGLLTGQLRAKTKRLRLAEIRNHQLDVVVGTHALLSDDVDFATMALCIIDEQHRFGVVQRATLAQKAMKAPHLLVMTATPIPRSLSLTYYGDLDVSIIDEMPPGRSATITDVISDADQQSVNAAVESTLARGERVYVVYPLIEESEKLDLQDATQGYERFARTFGEDAVGLVHGKIPADERAETMRAFSIGEKQILVATTVIEVGVDVPEATLMVVMHAERFGLSQLHQLRGRVGRGKAQSHCLLVVKGGGKDAMRRLIVMRDTNDGFRIAEEDLAIRGPGDFLGTRQHGLPALVFGDLRKYADLIEMARGIAEEIIANDGELEEHLGLKDLMQARYAERLALSRAG